MFFLHIFNDNKISFWLFSAFEKVFPFSSVAIEPTVVVDNYKKVSFGPPRGFTNNIANGAIK